MNKDNALGVLREVADAAFKSGIVTNLESAGQVVDAFRTVSTLVPPVDAPETPKHELTKGDFESHPELFTQGYRVGQLVEFGSIQVLEPLMQAFDGEEGGSDGKDNYPPRTVPFP